MDRYRGLCRGQSSSQPVKHHRYLPHIHICKWVKPGSPSRALCQMSFTLFSDRTITNGELNRGFGTADYEEATRRIMVVSEMSWFEEQ